MKEINGKTKEILEKEIKEVEKQYFQTLNDKDWEKGLPLQDQLINLRHQLNILTYKNYGKRYRRKK